MKKLSLIALLFLSALAADAAECLRVKPKSGDPVTFLFSESPEVSFTGSRLKVTSTSQPTGTYFEMDDVDSVDFTDDSGLSTPSTGSIEVFSDAAGVHFTGIPESATLAVFSVSGVMIHSGVCPGGEYHLLRSDLPSGIYIVKINEFTIKSAL